MAVVEQTTGVSDLMKSGHFGRLKRDTVIELGGLKKAPGLIRPRCVWREGKSKKSGRYTVKNKPKKKKTPFRIARRGAKYLVFFSEAGNCVRETFLEGARQKRNENKKIHKKKKHKT